MDDDIVRFLDPPAYARVELAVPVLGGPWDGARVPSVVCEHCSCQTFAAEVLVEGDERGMYVLTYRWVPRTDEEEEAR